jgi:hypothetical protein
MKRFSQFLKEESEDNYLYHATFRNRMKSISKSGLLSNPKNKNWGDSKPGRVYLAKDPHVALSYAESADEDVPEKTYNSGIVVYKIHKKHLDLDKIHGDENVQVGNGDHTVEYHGDIHPSHLIIHSEHDT